MKRTSDQPLRNRGIAVTRHEEPSGPLARRLERRGARVLRWHAVEIVAAANPAPLRAAVAALARFDWIVFASAHAVAAVAAMLTPKASESLARLRVATVGQATAAAAARAGLHVDRVPADFGAEGLLEGFRLSGDAAGARILIPGSDRARPELAAGLTALGATVRSVEAYRAVPCGLDVAGCRRELEGGAVDAITFTSPSAVEGVARAFGPGRSSALRAVRVISIGPTTSQALRDHGFELAGEAEPSTLDGLVSAVEWAFAGSRA